MTVLNRPALRGARKAIARLPAEASAGPRNSRKFVQLPLEDASIEARSRKVRGGRASRQKGDRREREIVALHAALGVKAERVPLSGAARYQGNGADVDVYARGPEAAPFVAEVKGRKAGAGFITLERWLGDHDALFLVRDRAKPLVMLPWDRWAELVSR